MKNIIQWFIGLVKRDMQEYEEDLDDKQRIFNAIRNEEHKKNGEGDK